MTSVSYGACAYVAGYVRKKVAYADNPDLYTRVVPETGELVNLQPEFARMSLRPAIGKRWIQKNWREVYAHDRVVMDGYELKPPRFYDRWMETDHSETQRPCPGGCADHQKLFMQTRVKRLEEMLEITPEALASREAHHRARVELFKQRKAF